MAQLTTIVNRLADDVTAGLDQVDNLKKCCLSDREAEITFIHARWRWLIRFPMKLPATVHYFTSEWSSLERDVILHGNYSRGPQALNSPELIIKAIQMTCLCVSCSSARRKYR